MTAKELLDKLPGIAYEAHIEINDGKERERQFVVTHFRYANGDLVNVYIDEDADELWLSDFGNTTYFLTVDGIEFEVNDVAIMQRMAVAHGAELFLDEIRIKTTPENAAKDVLNLCQAVSFISTAIYWAKRR